MIETLKERFLQYEEVSDFKLPRKLPVIIALNGRGFRKLTSLLDKPYCQKFGTIMGQIMIRLASEIDGCMFIYQFNDELHIICRNDQQLETEAWYNNRIAAMVSVAASLASVSLSGFAAALKIDLVGDPVFVGKAFVLPNWSETINYLINQQHICSNNAIAMACYYELLAIHKTPSKVLNLTQHLTIDEKYDLLRQECKVDLQNYPLRYWRGIACYRAPKVIETMHNKETKFKLTINDNLPFFSKEQVFLSTIFKKS